MSLFHEAARLTDQNIPFAWVTLIESKGSTPRHQASMIVLSEGQIIGTIGGGPVEHEVVTQAQEAIQLRCSRIVECVLNQNVEGGLNMHCGGTVKVHIEVYGSRPYLILIGGGHVNEQVGKLAHSLNFEVIVIDDRSEFDLEKKYPYASKYFEGNAFEELIPKASHYFMKDSFVVIATKDHDEGALRAILKYETAYIGVISSRRKAVVIRENLSDLIGTQTVHMPIGLDIGAETPEEIALSILSEILMVKNKATGTQLSKQSK